MLLDFGAIMASLPQRINLIGSLMMSIAIVDGELWHKVFVSQARLAAMSPKRSSLAVNFNVNLAAPYLPFSFRCSSHPWCQLFCFDNITGSLSFYDMIVMANYQEEDLNDALLCYTKLEMDLVVGAPIGGSPPDLPGASSLMEALVDGAYGYKMTECYKSIFQVNPWIYVDLGSLKQIGTVMLLFQPNTFASLMYNIEVRVHPNDSIPVDPSAGLFFGNLARGATTNEQVFFKAATKFYGRYVTVQRFTANNCDATPVPTYGYCCLKFCHLEIY